MKIFKTLLECAYGLDVLHCEEINPKYRGYVLLNDEDEVEKSGAHKEQGIYILTSGGDIEIYVTKHIDEKDGKSVHSFTSKFKSNIISIENELIMDLIKTQLETEAFLHLEDYEEVVCKCELIA